MKPKLKLAAGYLVGLAILFLCLFQFGTNLGNVFYLIWLWLPISGIYLILIYVVARLLQVLNSVAILPVSGVSVALLPLFSGLWPYYMMKPNFAVLIIILNLGIIIVIFGLSWLIEKLLRRN
jgi:hypothetical protein